MQFTLEQAQQLVASFGGDTETEMDVTYGDGNRGVGFYVYPTDHEDEGAVFLSDLGNDAAVDAVVEDIRQNLAGLHAVTNEVAKAIKGLDKTIESLTYEGAIAVHVTNK